MILGRDLQDRAVFVRPRQPTVFITPSLSLTRTKLGLALSGWLGYLQLARWKPSREEAQQIEDTLYPEKKKGKKMTESQIGSSSLLPASTQRQLNARLTVDFPQSSVTCLTCCSKCC